MNESQWTGEKERKGILTWGKKRWMSFMMRLVCQGLGWRIPLSNSLPMVSSFIGTSFLKTPVKMTPTCLFRPLKYASSSFPEDARCCSLLPRTKIITSPVNRSESISELPEQTGECSPVLNSSFVMRKRWGHSSRGGTPLGSAIVSRLSKLLFFSSQACGTIQSTPHTSSLSSRLGLQQEEFFFLGPDQTADKRGRRGRSWQRRPTIIGRYIFRHNHI